MSAGMLPESLEFQGLKIGDELPELTIDLTKRLIIGAAIASRDFEDVHHDTAAAQAAGMQDVFMNILTTNGLVGRYVSDWIGPNGIIKSLNIRLGMPNLPGDSMKMTGEILKIWQEKGENLVELDIKGKNSMGYHVTGSATVALPTGEGA